MHVLPKEQRPDHLQRRDKTDRHLVGGRRRCLHRMPEAQRGSMSDGAVPGRGGPCNCRTCPVVVIREAGTHEMKSLWLWIALFLWFGIAFFRGYQRSKRRTATAQGKVLRVRFGRLHLVFCPGNSLTKSRDFLEDRVGCGSPYKGQRICVVRADEVIDFFDEVGGGLERATTDSA